MGLTDPSRTIGFAAQVTGALFGVGGFSDSRAKNASPRASLLAPSLPSCKARREAPPFLRNQSPPRSAAGRVRLIHSLIHRLAAALSRNL